MKRTSKNPARKTTKPAAKKRGTTKERAVKDAASTEPAAPAADQKPRDPRCPPIGTKHTRVYNGNTLTLTALADGGFEFDGERFSSVSGAAKKACGAKTVDGFSWWRLNPADASKPPRTRDPRCPAIGTTYERVFKGKTLKLKALLDGTFEFDGNVYTSVSGAAKAASGAKTVDGFVWWGLNAAADAKSKKAAKAKPPKIGNGNDIGTDAGQRAALAELTKPRAKKGKGPKGKKLAADATTTESAAPEAK
jgi:hypothetical protein